MTVQPLEMPPTTGTFGNLSLVALTAKPADLTAITPTELAAGVNVSCHMVGDWWPTAETADVSTQRKMCQTSVASRNGETTHNLGTLTYTYMPQDVGTEGSDGNEAYEALPQGVVRYLVQRIGKGGKTPLAAGDAYRVFAAEMGPQIPGASADDAGGEAVITQKLGWAAGYTEPIDGVVAAGV